jgi:phosphatidylethanolamine-binding protein
MAHVQVKGGPPDREPVFESHHKTSLNRRCVSSRPTKTMSLSEHGTALSESLAKAGLVPGSAAGLIPENFKPTTRLQVSFADKAVELGTFLRAGECKVAPSLYFTAEENASPDTAYTFLLADPDAPTPDDPKFAFWRHWVISGLKPLSGGETVVAETKPALTAYLGPGPKDEYGLACPCP